MKNKKIGLVFVFLFLIALLSSAAYAQLLGRFGNLQITFLIINTLVIAFALFILQALLLKDKPEEQKTAVWFAILVISLVVAWVYGRNGYIWNIGAISNFFHFRVIVNTVIIAVAIYFTLSLIPQTKDKTNNTASIVLIILFSALLALQPLQGVAYSDQTYKYIWQLDTIKAFIDYLFGADGILRGTKIFVFIGSFVLLAWFFTGFLQLGNNFLNYSFAIILAANIAQRGATVDMVISLGEVITGFMIWNKVKETVKSPWSAAVISIILVGWVSSIIFPGKGLTAYFWPEGTTILGFFTSGWTMSLMVIGVFAVLGFGAYKVAPDVAARIASDSINYFNKKWKGFLRRTGIPGLNLLTRWIEFRDRTPKGEIPFILRDLRVELEVLMNYMLRLEVFFAKENAVKGFVEKSKDLRGVFGNVDPPTINNVIIGYRTGPEIIVEDNEFKTKGGGTAGWGRGDYLIGYLFNMFNKTLARRDFTSKIGEAKDQQIEALRKTLIGGRDVMGDVQVIIKTMEDESWSRYWTNMRRYGASHLLKCLQMEMLDQYVLHGKYQHSYLFAKPEAHYDLYEYKASEGDGVVMGVNINDKPSARVNSPIGYEASKLPYEVDIDGFVIVDKNEIAVEGKGGFQGRYIRKVHKKDIYNYDELHYSKVCDWLDKEWRFFLDDFRDGRFHHLSRSFPDYSNFHDRRIYNYSEVRREGNPGRGRPAFDREALKDPGKWTYWGKKHYFEGKESDVGAYRKNPYPGLSTVGISSYIADLVEKWVLEVDEREKHLQRYVYDVAGAEIFSKTPKKEEK